MSFALGPVCAARFISQRAVCRDLAINQSVYRAQQVILRHIIVGGKLLEQCALRF
ncbi:hypothetical protein Z949_3946 [Sulfitobacter guttiformis KCTC 32187]|nr:hypothetical protein Z949_3946 [Sulfitobacter guttiformis KCTC 32187]